MERNRIAIAAPGGNLHLVLGKTEDEYLTYYGKSYDLWDVPIEELLDGTIEINQDIWYWLINGRCYETTEEVEE